MSQYQIDVDNFSGPLSKLLSLIENKKYEITSLNLANVTGDFIDYLNSLEHIDARILADFIAVASKLILIKSKELIPNLELAKEEEEEIRDLEDRLKIYQEFQGAISHFTNLYNSNYSLFSRPEKKIKKEVQIIFNPPESLTKEVLLLNLKKAINLIEELDKRYEKYTAMNFEEAVSNLWNRVSGTISNFSHLSSGRKKSEVIVLFLAILHLLYSNQIIIEQNEHFSDIIIKSN